MRLVYMYIEEIEGVGKNGCVSSECECCVTHAQDFICHRHDNVTSYSASSCAVHDIYSYVMYLIQFDHRSFLRSF